MCSHYMGCSSTLATAAGAPIVSDTCFFMGPQTRLAILRPVASFASATSVRDDMPRLHRQ